MNIGTRWRNREVRAARRAHQKDARAWVQETSGQDWVLVKVIPSDQIEEYIYIWAGPPGTRTRHPCYGTEHSVLFLEMLREALTAFRHQLAHEVTYIPADVMDYTI